MLSRPTLCRGCSLDDKALGFAPPTGPRSAPLAVIGEALGRYEAYKGEPFIGPSGSLLNRLLRMLGRDRGDIRIGNVISCEPPRDWLDGAPWERAAIQHCRRHLQPVLDEGHQAVVALGGSSMRALLGLPKAKKITMENFHGYPVRDPTDRFWVVPSYHPAFILRDNHALTGVLLHDLQQAFEVSERGWDPVRPHLVVDPPLDWLRGWVDAYLHSQDTSWLAVDIETPDKGEEEDELEVGGGVARTILRINLGCSTDEGITIPWAEPFLGEIKRALSSRGVKLVWNGAFDIPVLTAHGAAPAGPVYDGMWMWHVLQSDLKKGLGFVASFYGADRPWKHLSDSDFGIYSALDAVNTVKCCYGIAADLQREGMWSVFERHIYQLDRWGLRPAEAVGLAANRSGLERLGQDMAKELVRLEGEIKTLVSPEARPVWAPSKAGWSKAPSGETLARIQKQDEMEELPEIITREMQRDVVCCRLCSAEGVTRSHNCQKPPKKVKEPKARAEGAGRVSRKSRKQRKVLTSLPEGVD